MSLSPEDIFDKTPHIHWHEFFLNGQSVSQKFSDYLLPPPPHFWNN